MGNYYGVFQEEKSDFLKFLGIKCKEFRISKQKTQRQVALNMGYTKELISAFELGKTNNAFILLSYVNMGFNFDEFVKLYNKHLRSDFGGVTK